MTSVTIDRHVLASSPGGFDLAWRSFGWSPALSGARAHRLEEEVPWGTLADRARTPGWLAGTPAEIVEPANVDRLQWAFLPLDGRLGLSVWGAGGDRTAPPGKRRVLTHSLIMDARAFAALSGYPFGLFGTPARPAPWLKGLGLRDAFARPTDLTAVTLRSGSALTRAFQTARIAEIRRLRAVLQDAVGYGAEDLAYALARVYDALASLRERSERAPAACVAFRDDVPGAPLLVRTAWLSLPLEDRARTWFNSEQARTERPRAHLVVLPLAEWGRAIPKATVVLDPGDGRGPPLHPGRLRWARAVAGCGDPTGAVAAFRQADARGWCLLGPDTASPALETHRILGRAGTDGPEVRARALAAAERERPRPRGRGPGHLLAGSVAVPPGADLGALAGELVAEARAMGLPAGRVVDGLVRGLLRTGPVGATLAGFARCVAALGDASPEERRALVRLGEREAAGLAALLEHPDGLGAVVLAATAVRRGGDGLDAGGPGSRLVAALARPDRVRRVLEPEARVPAASLLELIDWDGDAILDGVDRVGPAGLGTEAMAAIATGDGADEALDALERSASRNGGTGAARLQLLAHPAWRRGRRRADRAYRLAYRMLAAAHGTFQDAELRRTLRPWQVESGRLEDPESLLVAELVTALLDRGEWHGESGEAVGGQGSGGVVWSAPAVSPSVGVANAPVARLSASGIDALLDSVSRRGLFGPAHEAGLLPVLLRNPALEGVQDPGSLDALLRLLWAEWEPERGAPSLRFEAGVPSAVQAVAKRLLAAPAPLLLREELRRVADVEGPVRGRAIRPRRVFLSRGTP